MRERDLSMRSVRKLLAAMFVILALAPAFALQPASAQPIEELQYLCVSRVTGVARAVQDASDCSRYELLIDLAEDAPVNVCANRVTGVITIRDSCTRYEQPVVLGGEEPVDVCISVRTGQLRYSASGDCGRGEAGGTVPGVPSTDCLTIGDCPLAIPLVTGSAGDTTSNLVVSDPAGGAITDVNVSIDIAHTFLNDLEVFLASPTGTVVELFTDICGGEDDIAVTLDDQASTSIDVAPCASPFTGTFQPEGSLADFAGESASGTWQLQISDVVTSDVGVLWSWTLEITTDQGGVPPVTCTDCVLPIPNSGSGGSSGVTISQLPVSATGAQIADLDLTVDLDNALLRHLAIHLLSPSGTHVNVIGHSCGGDDDLQVIFDDEAAGGLDCPTRLGFNRFQPLEPLAAFDGENPDGLWHLVVFDVVDGDVGTLNNWSLDFDLS